MLYRKRPRPADADLLRGIREDPFAAFCITSPAAGEWLLAGAPREAIGALQAIPAVVLGPFLAALSGRPGFHGRPDLLAGNVRRGGGDAGAPCRGTLERIDSAA